MGTNKSVYQQLVQSKELGVKQFAVLIDPDNIRLDNLKEIVHLAVEHGVDYFFIGGSLILHDQLDQVLTYIKSKCHIPCLLFPGNTIQINNRADAILFLSLISGRNADLLIGQQVQTAPYLKRSSLEVLSTGYMLIDGGVETAVSYISNTRPIPANKIEIAQATAMAAEMLGMKLIYMDAGSGAKQSISKEMIQEVSKSIDSPLIIGGGIRSIEAFNEKLKAGADIVVVGNAIEQNPVLIEQMANSIQQMNAILS